MNQNKQLNFHYQFDLEGQGHQFQTCLKPLDDQ